MASWLCWGLWLSWVLCALSHELHATTWPHAPLQRVYVVYLDKAPQDRWNATLSAVVGEVGVKPFAEYYVAVLESQRAKYPDTVQFYEAHLAEFQATWETLYHDLLLEIYALADILQDHAQSAEEKEACSRNNIFLAMMHMQIGNIGVQECTSVVLRQRTGDVLHFRNWDFLPLPDVLGMLSVQVEFARRSSENGAEFRCLIALTHIHKWTTCMRPGKFSMSLNARYSGAGTERGRAPERELELLKQGRLPRVALLRDVMLATTYESALHAASTAPALTSMYVILAAPKPSEEGVDAQGAIVTIEGNANASDVMLLPAKGEGWFIVQTNIDHSEPMAQDRPSSHRREHMKALLNALGPDADATQYYATLRNESVFPDGNSGPDDGKVFRNLTIASVLMRPGQVGAHSWRADVWRPAVPVGGALAAIVGGLMRRWGRRLVPAQQPPICLDGEDVEESPHEAAARPLTTCSATQPNAACSAPTANSCLNSSASAGTSPSKSAASSRSGIPINPRLSMAFASKAAAGEKRFADPSVPATSSSTPAAISAAAQHERPGTLVWVRPFDLRIHDNPALTHAARRGRPVYVVFPWSDEEDAQQGVWRLGGTAYAFWLHHALQSLDASLQRAYGLRVVYRTGSSIAAVLTQVAQECCADEVVTSTAYDPAGKLADRAALAALSAGGVKLLKFQSFLLHSIEDVRVDMTSWRGHFGTLTPFHSACYATGQPQKPLAVPDSIRAGGRALVSEGLSALRFARMPVRKDGSRVDWGAPILDAWSICEEAALAILRQFLAPGGGFSRYEKERHLADASALSRLSPYLRAGMLSCRRMYWAIMDAGGREVSVTFWRRLIWRDLAYWQLHHFPEMQEKPIRAHYSGQTWRNGAIDGTLSAWRRGMTGFPLVDAGMRELWATGWMAQNARMAAAVLLCELLNINWVEGEIWFHHTLVDADPAINAMMWQNAGKGGLDQWNFTLHPVNSGRTQDPHGKYLRKWLPELAGLPNRYLHAPWEASADILSKAGVVLGAGGGCGAYPERIITDIRAASRVSTSEIREQRARNLAWNDAGGYDLIILPSGSTTAHDGQKFRIFTKKDWRLPSGGNGWSSWNGEEEQGEGESAGDSWTHSQVRGGRQQTAGRGGHNSHGQDSHGQGSTRNQRRRVDLRAAKSNESGAAGSFQTVLDEYIQKASGA